jgi:tRNA-2-methylthio-N6-dimethylallyladenosine synthase
MKKFYIQTHGCQINQSDSERIAQAVARLDYVPTDQIEAADLLLLNTCSVRDKAEQKVYSVLGSWKVFKEQREGLIIGVGGCVAQQEGEKLLKRMPHLDLVFGTHNIHRLPQLIEEVRTSRARPVENAFYRTPDFMEDAVDRSRIHGPKAYVPIMQGCNKVCSFCVVPYVRGREVSRSSVKIVGEIQELVRGGVKEVILLGQNVNSYGKLSPGEVAFPELLSLVNDIEGLERIRFTTSHPQDLSPELIDAFASLEHLCEHLHLPVQSGSDDVLTRMRRGYTVDEYRARIGRLNRQCPQVVLSTDIIVGFPGESDADFECTLELLREVKYDELYSFIYSPRPQTVSAKIYADDVPGEVKRDRLQRVQALQQEISLAKNRGKIGEIEEILVEGRSKLKNGRMMGRTRTNRIVNVAGPGSLVGALLPVRVIGATANSLLGEIARAESATLTQLEGDIA